MTAQTADIVICGAGIAGIASAHHLAVRHGVKNVLLVDDRSPLTLTSDKSTEAYRNWWPGPDDAMIRLMNRSIDLLEKLADECDNRFLLNRRGYIYATGNPLRAEGLRRSAELASEQGAGPLRILTGGPSDPEYVSHSAEEYRGQPEGADLILDRRRIRKQFPYLSEQTVAVLHVRRCGWFSGQQLGMLMLERARQQGVRFRSARVTDVTVDAGRVAGVTLAEEGGTASTVSTRAFVNAAGPMLKQIGAMVGVELPVFSELHLKASMKDHLGLIPRDAPLLIWEDPQRLPWTAEEQAMLAESDETRELLDELPPGVHTRPEGGAGSRNILILWPYHVEPVNEIFPLPEDPFYPEIVLRGTAAMVPDIVAYFGQMPRIYVDGGYYTKTRENRLLCGPLPVDGTFVIGALSGYGLMASCAAAELLAAHVTGSEVADYARAFSLERYDDPSYTALLEDWGSTGQL